MLIRWYDGFCESQKSDVLSVWRIWETHNSVVLSVWRIWAIHNSVVLPVWRNSVNPTIGCYLSMMGLGNPQFGRSTAMTESANPTIGYSHGFGKPTILIRSLSQYDGIWWSHNPIKLLRSFLRTTLLHTDRFSDQCPLLGLVGEVLGTPPDNCR